MINYRINGTITRIEIVTIDNYFRYTNSLGVSLRLIDDTDSITVVQISKDMRSNKIFYHYTTYNKSDIKRIQCYTEEMKEWKKQQYMIT